MSKKIHVGMIGVGGVGEAILKSFRDSELTIVLGFHDTNAERIQAIHTKYGIDAYSSYQKLLDNQEIDLIYIGVPPKYHHSIALDAMAAGKHILCEKPLANSLEEARELAEEAEKRNKVYAMNFPTIYRPAFIEMENLVEKLGPIQKIEVQCYFKEWPRPWQHNAWISSREQGGFIKEVFPHYIQMIQRLFGEFSLQCSTIRFPENVLLSETGVIAAGETASGIPILFNGASGIGKEYLDFSIYGSECTVSLVNWRELWVTTKSGKEQVHLNELTHLEELITNVVYAIHGKPSSIVKFSQGYEVQKILESF